MYIIAPVVYACMLSGENMHCIYMLVQVKSENKNVKYFIKRDPIDPGIPPLQLDSEDIDAYIWPC